MIKNLKIVSDNSKIRKPILHKFISALKNELNINIVSLEINFINADDIKEVNNNFLNHNYSTDIITFNYSHPSNNIDAEILISLDDAFENSKKYKVKFMEEIGRLIIHGLLHLIGYDDKKPKEKEKMKQLENELLNRNKFVLLRSR